MENACGTSHMESAGEVVKILYDMVEKWTKETFERYTFVGPLFMISAATAGEMERDTWILLRKYLRK